MVQNENARASVRAGAFYQFLMIAVWALRGFWFSPASEHTNLFSLRTVLFAVGSGIMVTTMLRIYVFNSQNVLLTSDLFAVTRHPMYHGMFLADLALFLVGNNVADPVFWVNWVAFVALMCGAGWHQEQETLARWGSAARDYYARTPRFVFEWLWK